MPKADMDQIITSPSAEIFLRMVTKGFYDNSYTALWIFEVIGREWDDMRAWAEGLKQEIHPQTCTWTIPIWEWIYGFEPDDSMTLEQRRQRIMAKVVGVRPINPEIVRKGVATLTGIPEECVEVADPVGPYRFEIVFKDLEDSISGKQVRRYVYTIKPSHLSVGLTQVFAYVFDHSKLEIIQVPVVRFHLGMGFWGAAHYDGNYLYDGRLAYQNWRRYDINIGTGFNLKGIYTHEEIYAPEVRYLMAWSVPEKLSDPQISLKAEMYYWYDYDATNPDGIAIYNGDHKYDGSAEDHTQVRRYGMHSGIGYVAAEIATEEAIEIAKVDWTIPVPIAESFLWYILYGFSMQFWGIPVYDGTARYDGEMGYASNRWPAEAQIGVIAEMRQIAEQVGEVSMESRSRTQCFYNGGHRYDGSCNHSTFYRKEVVE